MQLGTADMYLEQVKSGCYSYLSDIWAPFYHQESLCKFFEIKISTTKVPETCAFHTGFLSSQDWKKNHRITERLRLEGTSEDCLVQPHCSKQGHLERVAQEHMQLSFEILQGWGFHNNSGQSVSMFDQPYSKKAFCKQNLLPYISYPLSLALSLSSTVKSLIPSSLLPDPIRYLWCW